jgi:hypothetical protein
MSSFHPPRRPNLFMCETKSERFFLGNFFAVDEIDREIEIPSRPKGKKNDERSNMFRG